MRIVTRFTPLVLAILLQSCALLEPQSVRPSERTAVMQASEWGKVYRGGYVEIAAANGVEPGWRLRSEMELAAGPQNALFYVYLCTQGGSKHCNAIAQAQVHFVAQVKHSYRVRAREQVNGSNRFWVWVEDAATGEAVGGSTPDQSTSRAVEPRWDIHGSKTVTFLETQNFS